MIKRKSIKIANETIKAGESRCVKLALAMLYTSSSLEVPVYVFHGKKEALFFYHSSNSW